MKVEGEGVSLTLFGRTRDSCSYFGRSDLVTISKESDKPFAFEGRGSPPKVLQTCWRNLTSTESLGDWIYNETRMEMNWS